MGLFDQSQGLMGLGQQGGLPTPQKPNISNFNSAYYQSPQYQSYLNNMPQYGTDDMSPMPFGGYGSSSIGNYQQQSYDDFLKNPSMGQQPQGEQYIGASGSDFMPQEEFGVPSPFMNQGAMQQPQGDSFLGGNPFTQTGYPGVKPTGMGGFYAEETGFTPPQGYNQLGEFTGQRPQDAPPMQQPQPVNETGFYQAMPNRAFFEGPTKGQIPNGFSMINGEMVNLRGVPQSNSSTPALNPTPQPPQIFQPQPMQQLTNPVNTQTVQPNFMGQTPFGQAQTGQFTSTNPFVQAAQANAQGNIAGALQATAANRINQQTPYGSLSYQQTGTDAQGNPIWSANQNLSPELQQLTQSSLAGLQASQANPMYGINPGDTYSNAIMQRLAPQQRQQAEALDAQLANQGIMPGSEAYNRAKTLLGQTQNDALTSAIVGGMQTGLQAQGLQNTTAANIRNLATPGYVTPYNQAAVAGPDYLSAYTSQNATDIARANAEAAQRSSLLGGLAGLGSSAILGGTGPNSALGGLYGLGSKGLEALGNTSLWNSLFGTGPAITGDQDFLKSIGLAGSTYGSGTGGMLTDPLADLYTQASTPDDLSYLFNSAFGYDF